MKPVADLQRVQTGISATAFLMVCVKVDPVMLLEQGLPNWKPIHEVAEGFRE